MEGWQTRLVDEEFELSRKLARLDLYLLEPKNFDRSLLVAQQFHMYNYQRVLRERIAAF